MTSPSSILLRSGTVLVHDDADHVVPTVADVLIQGSLITKIAPGIEPPSADTRVVDVAGKLLGPGYVDTHHHLWQTAYKGQHANHTLMQYLPGGNNTSVFFEARDLFYGQLSGALEAIDGGTTTLVDHAHCNTGPDHPPAAIRALVSSGLRCVYCLSPRVAIIQENPLLVNIQYYSPESVAEFHTLASRAPYGNGRVHIGATLDDVYVDADTIKNHYAQLRGTGSGGGGGPPAKLITTHSVAGPIAGGDKIPSTIQVLDSHGLLGPDVLISHGNHPKPGDGALYAASGAHVSSTPNSELQMGEYPVAFLPDHFDNASLGVDCHTWGVGDMPGQMRMGLQAARLERGSKLATGRYAGHEGKKLWSRQPGVHVADVYNLGTIGGAKAAGLGGEVGRLRVGYKADILVYDTDTPRMLAAAQEDPVAAIVLHSCPGDISMVIVDGVVRKEGGKLVDVVVEAIESEVQSDIGVAPGARLTWKDIARELLDSRLKIKERSAHLDMVGAEDLIAEQFHWDRDALLEAQP